MSRAVAIGEEALLEGYALAGVDVLPAAAPAAAREAWELLDRDVALVLLTPAARDALGEERLGGERPWAVLPG